MKRDGRVQYFLAGHYFPNSSVLLLPVELHRAPGAKAGFTLKEARPITQIDQPVLLPIYTYNTEVLSAATWVCHSVLWQERNLPDGSSKDRQFRFYVDDSKWNSVPWIAAEEGFYMVEKAVCEDVAKACEVDLEPGLDLFGVIFHLCLGILKCSVERALALAHKRLARSRNVNRWSPEILYIEEAVDLLDIHDQKEIPKEQARVKEQLAAVEEFALSYRKKMATVRAAALPKGRPVPPNPQRPLPDHMPQDEVSRFKPPGSFVWRGVSAHTWCGHYPPGGYARHSRSRSLYGEKVARLIILATLWRDYLEHKSLDDSHCPWKGLLEYARID